MAVIIFRLVFIPILLSAFTAESYEHPQEDARKAHHLLQLTKFIHWPSTLTKNAPLTLCLFTSTPAQDNWQEIHLQKSQGHEIQLHYISQDHQLSQCNILFVHKQIANNVIRENYYNLISNSVLTIGERMNFAKEGGVIEVNLSEENFDIKINFQTVIEAGLSINANLIEIASTVYKQGQI